VGAGDVRKRPRDDSGAVGLAAAIIIAFVMLALVALVTDVGMLYVERHSLQAAADAGALAGARAYLLGEDWRSVATSYAQRNLPAGASVDPPTNPRGDYVKVTVRDGTFRAPLASSTSQVTAVAAAAAQTPTAYNGSVMPLVVVVGSEQVRSSDNKIWNGANRPYSTALSASPYTATPNAPSVYPMPYGAAGLSADVSVPHTYIAADDKVGSGVDKTYGVQPMLRGWYREIYAAGGISDPQDGKALLIAQNGIEMWDGDQLVLHSPNAATAVIAYWFGAVGGTGTLSSVPDNFSTCVQVDPSTGFATIAQYSPRLVIVPVAKWPSWMTDGKWGDAPYPGLWSGAKLNTGWAAQTVRVVGWAWMWLDDKALSTDGRSVIGVKARYIRPLGFDESKVPDVQWGSPDPYGAVTVHLVDPASVP
jgi:Flp pilus assembly protein TadG